MKTSGNTTDLHSHIEHNHPEVSSRSPLERKANENVRLYLNGILYHYPIIESLKMYN